jgi:hypothetical protein
MFLVSVEVLVDILCLACGYDTFGYTLKSLGPLCNVCVHWRQVIIGFASFWRTVDVVILKKDEVRVELPNTKTFLGIVWDARNIEIWPHGCTSDPFPNVIAPLPLLFGIMGHVRELTIDRRGRCLDDTLLRSLRFSGELKDLMITNVCYHNHQLGATPQRYYLPNVESVSLCNVNCVIVSASLTILSFTSLSIGHAFTILSHCPNLVTVFLWYINARFNTPDPFTQLTMDRVENLTIHACPGALKLLTPLRLPELKYLSIGLDSGRLNMEDLVHMVGSRVWEGRIRLSNIHDMDAAELEVVFPHATVTVEVLTCTKW